MKVLRVSVWCIMHSVFFWHSNHSIPETAILSWYYRLNVCVPPKLACWNLIPSVMVWGVEASGWRLGYEGGALINGISAVVKQTLIAPCHIRTHQEESHLYTRRQALTSHWICQGLDPGLPCSRIVRNKC